MKKVTRTRSSTLVKSSGEAQSYSSWIADLKRRYRATQIKAAVAVNSALIEFYWNLGKDISEKYLGKKRNQTNFDLTMPSDDCDLARQLVKDPQKFEVFGSSFLHRAVASLSRRGGQDRQVRACRS